MQGGTGARRKPDLSSMSRSVQGLDHGLEPSLQRGFWRGFRQPLWQPLWRGLSLSLLLLGLVACQGSNSTPGTSPLSLAFVRGGLIVEGTAGQVEVLSAGQRLTVQRLNLDPKGEIRRQLLRFDWQAGTAYDVQVGTGTQTLVAPQKPTPYPLRQVPLKGDAEAASAALPDVDLAFSPDGSRLAVGTLFGQLLVMETFSGKILFDKTLAEGMVKRVAFSPDGQTLYAGEQSPDGFLYALDALTGDIRWKKRLADDLESARPPAKEDRYALYFLPGVFGLKVLKDGRVMVAGVHSWNVEGVQKNRSRLYIYQPDGTLAWQFPEKAPLDGNILTFDVDAAGTRGAFSVSRSASTPPSADALAPGIYGLDLTRPAVTWKHVFEILKPHFREVFVWEALAMSPDGNRVVVGLGDGRAAIFDATVPGPDSKLLSEQTPGTPIDVSNVPISTPVSYAHASPHGLYFQTNNSNIPFGTEATARTPPAPHPAARSLFAVDMDGQLKWRYQSAFTPSGIWTSRDGNVLMMTTANASSEQKTDRHGFVLLDARIDGPVQSDERLLYQYHTEGPVFFHAALSPDGLTAAVVETPARKDDNRTLYGKWQLHLVE